MPGVRPLLAPLALAALVAATGALSCFAADPEARSSPPNLILVSIDTLRADHVGAYGYPRPTTPHIDALASDGVLFRACVAHAPTTLASHASILTSLLPVHHGASISKQTRLADGVPTLAELLSGAGYQTASFNGGLQLDRVYGLDRGFQHYESTIPKEAEPEALSGPESRLIEPVRRGLAWLRDAAQPFFLFLHSYEIHHPYTPDADRLARFDRGYRGRLPDHISVAALRHINRNLDQYTQEDLRHVVAAYDAELSSADAAIGVLVRFLRDAGLYDDTMIVITSDHGEEFGERGKVGWHSHSLFDELLMVPLVVKFPGQRFAGTIVDAQVRGIDVAPTALGVLGLEPPEHFAGQDLGAMLVKGVGADLPAISMFDLPGDDPRWTLRSPSWKLHRLGRLHLFDLARDPRELESVASRTSGRLDAMHQQGLGLMSERELPPRHPVRPDPRTEEQLRALGYIE